MTHCGCSLADVVAATHAIPCAPAILPKLLGMTQSDKADACEMEKLILTDPGLAAGVLRLANSAYFASSHRCESIAEAILRLGSTALYRLAATTVAARWLLHPTGSGYGWQPGDLCRHSLCVAVSAEIYAQHTGIVPPETAYTAGMIHDVGKLALASANERALEDVARLVPEVEQVWEDAEVAVLGYSSADVTRELLQGWSFPKNLVDAGCYHAHPSDAPEESRALVALIHAAKNVATALGFGIGANGFHTVVDESILRAHGFDEGELVEEIPNILERLQHFLEPDGRLKGEVPDF